MPIECDVRWFPSGEPYLYVSGAGRLTVSECEVLVAYVARPEFGGKPKVLSLTAKGTEYPSEVRKFIRTVVSFEYQAWASVVDSLVVRATINVLMRMAPTNLNFRMFDDEGEAYAWLEAEPPSPAHG